ncbi:MAG: GpE family phage tail protein [Alphaproteobacteria bacterium]
MEEVAWTFHFPPSELERMTVSQLRKWHRGAARINKQLAGIGR